MSGDNPGKGVLMTHLETQKESVVIPVPTVVRGRVRTKSEGDDHWFRIFLGRVDSRLDLESYSYFFTLLWKRRL